MAAADRSIAREASLAAAVERPGIVHAVGHHGAVTIMPTQGALIDVCKNKKMQSQEKEESVRPSSICCLVFRGKENEHERVFI